ncbi:Gfo/Idh/MocA family oxidoreductase [Rhodospirillaceae bacterium KN72]|uniref:Gfo/Idh/MocA family oxidoreductase n=1 Tax=Pacificispira spongiicola TaxID=2729598 RepID=A0A7Y0HF92_9PROT|nr:Gfo/Idh/MocA family oxidoreductase [Pacificispira spongiicola]NMM45575.1 Gfo/Idh/MocA family oxidoreductase [Pacificispira spongiicola]
MKVAFAGAGYMASEHAKAFSDIDGVQLVGVVGRSADRARQFAEANGIPAMFETITALYEQARPDILVVAVDEVALKSILAEAAPFDWTIMAEKPLGVNVDEADEIAAFMEKGSARLYVAMNRRLMGSTLSCMADVDSRDELRFIKVQDQQSYAEARDSGKPEVVVRNYMYANSIHLVDYLLTFGRGAVVSVTPIFSWEADSPGVVAASVEFSSGDRGLYEAIWNGPGPWAVSVSTPARRWEMRPLEQAAYQDAGQRRLVAVDADSRDTDFKPGLRLMADEAVRAATGDETALVPMAEAIRTMRLVAAIYGHRPYSE